MNPVRVLVVDDSVVIRRLLTAIIDADLELEVAGVAANGRIAIERVRQLRPDIVTLDVEMPELDGIETLELLRAEHPTLPIVMFSTLTVRGAAATLDALTRGASDYVSKPANVGSVNLAMERVRSELVPKLKALCHRTDVHDHDHDRDHDRAHRVAPAGSAQPGAAAAPAGRAESAARRVAPSGRVELVAIGSSTGGPNALGEVLRALPASLAVPVVVVQHMPPVFTALLAQRLDATCAVSVHEGAPGTPLEPGHVYIAPGDHHMVVVDRHGCRELDTNQDEPEHFCRPAVDVLFRSVAASVGGHVLAVVLTGMGTDGQEGAGRLRDLGARVIVQDRPTSVVWGMPGAVATAGYADEILPLGQIGGRIDELVASGRRVVAGARPR